MDHEVGDGGVGVAGGSEGLGAFESEIKAGAGQHEGVDRRWNSIHLFTDLLQETTLSRDHRSAIVCTKRGPFVRAVSIGHPRGCVLCRDAHCLRARRGDSEGHPRLLDAAGVASRPVSAPVPALEVDGTTGQKVAEEADELGEAVHPLGDMEAELPTANLRVTSTDLVAGGSASYSFTVKGNQVGVA